MCLKLHIDHHTVQGDNDNENSHHYGPKKSELVTNSPASGPKL